MDYIWLDARLLRLKEISYGFCISLNCFLILENKCPGHFLLGYSYFCEEFMMVLSLIFLSQSFLKIRKLCTLSRKIGTCIFNIKGARDRGSEREKKRWEL